MYFTPTRGPASSVGRCHGCGHYRLDLERGAPARESGLPRHARLCEDCRDYICVYTSQYESGWHSDAALAAMLEAIAPSPDAPDERYFHDDLHRLSTLNLRAERATLRLRLLLDPGHSPWHAERLRRVEELLRHEG